eukprot:tig00000269_g23747.t1
MCECVRMVDDFALEEADLEDKGEGTAATAGGDREGSATAETLGTRALATAASLLEGLDVVCSVERPATAAERALEFLHSAHCLVIVISHDTVQDPAVREQVLRAHALQKNIVPVVMADFDWRFPEELEAIQFSRLNAIRRGLPLIRARFPY